MRSFSFHEDRLRAITMTLAPHGNHRKIPRLARRLAGFQRGKSHPRRGTNQRSQLRASRAEGTNQRGREGIFDRPENQESSGCRESLPMQGFATARSDLRPCHRCRARNHRAGSEACGTIPLDHENLGATSGDSRVPARGVFHRRLAAPSRRGDFVSLLARRSSKSHGRSRRTGEARRVWI